MKMRNEEVAVIKSVSVEHEVKKIGTAFASVVLWY